MAALVEDNTEGDDFNPSEQHPQLYNELKRFIKEHMGEGGAANFERCQPKEMRLPAYINDEKLLADAVQIEPLRKRKASANEPIRFVRVGEEGHWLGSSSGLRLWKAQQKGAMPSSLSFFITRTTNERPIGTTTTN